jgi:tRNA G18 (ribose-2'-O)-methylase SpoU
MDKTFSKPKFFKLDHLQKHKKCASLLRLIYENMLIKKKSEKLILHYKELTSWMGISNNLEKNFKKISDLYHYHLKEAKINLKEHNLLPSIRKNDGTPKEDFLENAIYLDNVRSAYNVGSIIRTTEALRIGSLYFSEKTPFIDNKKVIKISMGASNLVPCYQNPTLEKLPQPIIALETSDDAINIFDFIFPEKFTVILGNEEYGISDESLKKADYIIEIPMLGAKNSINVACAYSILAAQIKRQRNFICKTL